MSKSESQEFSQDDDHDEGGVNKACNVSKVKKDPEKSGENDWLCCQSDCYYYYYY